MSDPTALPDLASAFGIDTEQLHRAVNLLAGDREAPTPQMPESWPDHGIGAAETMNALAGPVLDDSRDLAAAGFFAHMDPPTPWLTWAMHLWTASQNQNLLHPDTAPAARDIEARVVAWLAPHFGMEGGHMTSGSTIANLTAIWAARQAGAHTVVATRDAHISVAKAAHLLGMYYRPISDWDERVSLDGCVAVITAGTTSTGRIEPLDAAFMASWRHIDAAWAGPLVFSDTHRQLLDGIERADSVAVSAHKWLFQPKESALVLFADVERAHGSISFGADYLAVPNVGVRGSHGAAAVPLLATLLAYGRSGIADWIDRSMALADQLARIIEVEPTLVLRTAPRSGVVNWRHRDIDAEEVQRRLPRDVFISTTTIDGTPWLRSVAANPFADPQLVARTVASLPTS